MSSSQRSSIVSTNTALPEYSRADPSKPPNYRLVDPQARAHIRTTPPPDFIYHLIDGHNFMLLPAYTESRWVSSGGLPFPHPQASQSGSSGNLGLDRLSLGTNVGPRSQVRTFTPAGWEQAIRGRESRLPSDFNLNDGKLLDAKTERLCDALRVVQQGTDETTVILLPNSPGLAALLDFADDEDEEGDDDGQGSDIDEWTLPTGFSLTDEVSTLALEKKNLDALTWDLWRRADARFNEGKAWAALERWRDWEARMRGLKGVRVGWDVVQKVAVVGVYGRKTKTEGPRRAAAAEREVDCENGGYGSDASERISVNTMIRDTREEEVRSRMCGEGSGGGGSRDVRESKAESGANRKGKNVQRR